MRVSTVAVVFWLLAAGPAAFAAGSPPDRSEESWPPRSAKALYSRAKRGVDLSGKTGYLEKRFVGGPFQVIPDAVLEQDLASGDPRANGRRSFVVLGPEGYSWHFTYDRAAGIPRYRHRVGSDPTSEVLEVEAPEAMAFAPVVDIALNQGLICTNVGTCGIPVCRCCIVCYCGLPGTMCDYDDTGFYSRFERLEQRNEVQLR